ncbi:MAG: LuxR C-terminal-related transcriptional regulator [Actinomycetota bacterium]
MAWIFLENADLPPVWRRRAVPGYMVLLAGPELERLTGAAEAEPGIDAEDEPILPLVARGLTVTSIASRMGITPRTVERRLARLRERLEVGSTAELAVLLAERGFGRVGKTDVPSSEEFDQGERTTD